ncbi:phage tail assembly protein [Fuscibacter oryzae]|uniref:Phage tail assembly protein n=1 Tax=Fuscibacter oryzae TaxID=2803939 RepID=A0A8J7SWV3_9RHOB|nr:phage tail assembly protein [Fuscibacter oryzae]MBL4929319.1 phage tail assembly protein [Fuscibacter oryzae]
MAKDHIIDNGDGTVTVKLATPIKIDGASTSAVLMREPTVGDQMVAAAQAKNDEAKAEVNLFGNLCNLSPEDMRSLTMRNYGRLQDGFRFFTD